MSIAYRIALLIHIASVLAAISTATLVHFAHRQARAATRPAAARRWLQVILRASAAFPIVLLGLLATGGYMVTASWTWRAGWVIAGLAGLAFLLVNGIRLGKGGRALLRDLEAASAAEGGMASFADTLRRDDAAAWANTGVALSVVVAMTTKPGIVGALATVVAGGVIGALIGARSASAVSTAPESALSGEIG
jgi:hypothetical protein